MTEIRVVHGPMIDESAEPIYQVTLASGMILTRPSAFGNEDAGEPIQVMPIIADDGRILGSSTTG